MEGTTNVSKVFKCPSCSYESKLKCNLTRHVKVVHDKIKNFECDKCTYTSYFKGNLTIHVKAVHDKIKDIKCDQCSYTVSRKEKLTRHVKAVHDKIKNFECDRCDARFSFKEKLVRHVETCTGKSSLSSMELKMKQVLDELKIEHMYNSTHDDLRGSRGRLRFDFIVPTLDESYFMIEMNGRQHYGPVQFGGMDKDQALENFERQLAHDGLKRAYCAKNNYPLLEVKYNDDREYRVILEEFISDSGVSDISENI